MLAYDQPLYRPPSEGRSFILQATLGCSWNRCSFCGMYKTKRFRIRPLEDVLGEARNVAARMPGIQRIFIADGDALVLKLDYWLALLAELYEIFPYLERVSSYAMPRNILRKSHEELVQIREAGVSMLYYGIESGDPLLLEKISKGASQAEIIEAGQKAQAAGFDLSCTVVTGVGGRKYSTENALGTAHVISEIAPKFASALSLMLPHPELERGFLEQFAEPFEPLSSDELLSELGLLVANIHSRTTFRSNHASNHLALKGDLPTDKEALLATIHAARSNASMLRPEWQRGL